ncbi:hypothetical protein HMPREF0682_2451 [Propionibacterium acidifaciens F0233]|uniref:Uncharacterized protein n=1 Tax=Propionibacterium acidifaciens F0233 TaxID=553198 RepID=U2RM17_9ACTN|nr:hypothetical protein HMPREF0682_2451 [Propionibacterium acidifaciens F0233]
MAAVKRSFLTDPGPASGMRGPDGVVDAASAGRRRGTPRGAVVARGAAAGSF